MQIQLDPKQMEYLRRQAEATEKIAAELSKLRKLGSEVHATLIEMAQTQKARSRD